MTTVDKIHKVDAAGEILGRLAVRVAVLLRGKRKVGYLPNVEPKEKVVVFNIEKISVSGKKMKQKTYVHHTGYPHGLRSKTLEVLFQQDPCRVLYEAVYGMLPKNRMREKVIKNLKLYKKEIK